MLVFGLYRLKGARHDKRNETKVARSEVPNQFHQNLHSNDWYFCVNVNDIVSFKKSDSREDRTHYLQHQC